MKSFDVMPRFSTAVSTITSVGVLVCILLIVLSGSRQTEEHGEASATEARYSCPEVIDQPSSNEWVKYKNERFSLSFDVPFNQNWTDDEVLIAPYEETQNLGGWTISFGPIHVTSDCVRQRRYFANLADLASTSGDRIGDAIDSIGAEFVSAVKEINNGTVIEFESPVTCENLKSVRVVTDRDVFLQISTSCSASGSSFAELEDVVRSVAFQ